ncbi:MAG TPA: hypothetical protein VNR87_07685 [Flavisolibacter sp.]|nr:hypothetical protein [Flavisolibacter sp.]
MELIKKILEKFNGLHYGQEYLCLAAEPFRDPLHGYLVDRGIVIKDITRQHLFIGYCPLILAFSSTAIASGCTEISLAFTDKVFPPGSYVPGQHLVASLSLRKIGQFNTDESEIFLFEGRRGGHRFISRFHQFIIQLHNNWYQRKPGNVYLKGNLYKQVQIAYSVPRKISLVTVGAQGLYNHFPTDLHGQASGHYYVISLRHGGKACTQVEQTKKIVLSDVKPGAYNKVYALGKNHMQPLKERQAFDFDTSDSVYFHLPLPKDLIAYRELELENSFHYGIHKLLLFRIRHERLIKAGAAGLCHIHNVYATWRLKKELAGNYLLR